MASHVQSATPENFRTEWEALRAPFAVRESTPAGYNQNRARTAPLVNIVQARGEEHHAIPVLKAGIKMRLENLCAQNAWEGKYSRVRARSVAMNVNQDDTLL